SNRFVTQRWDEGEVICREGEHGDTFYVIARGRASISHRAPDGSARQIAVLEDGDFFGEIALLEGGVRTATVHARTTCTCLTLEREQFDRLLRSEPGLRDVFEASARDRHARDARAVAAS